MPNTESEHALIEVGPVQARCYQCVWPRRFAARPRRVGLFADEVVAQLQLQSCKCGHRAVRAGLRPGGAAAERRS
eukprot:5741264-Pyramimonas_sp.AAC.1